VTDAVREQLDKGIEIGPQSVLTGEVAQLFCKLTGNARVAFANTGSEAVMAAIRIARTVTGRDKVVMFEGAYHGVNDEVIARAGPNGRGLPGAPGIPRSHVAEAVVLPYGEESSLAAIQQLGPQLAAVLVEPVQSRRPSLQPKEFLHKLRAITKQHDSALILDEVVTGFRTHPAGIRALYDIDADMSTYGKVVGGGYPIGVLAGHPRFLDTLDGGTWQFGDDSVPEVGVTFFAGTFVRHPVALAAARAVLERLTAAGPELQRERGERMTAMVAAINARMRELRAPIATSRARRRALPAPAATRGAARRGPQPERLARSSESTVVAAVLLMGWAVVLLRTGNGHAAIALAVAACALSWGPLLKRRARSCNAAT